jgi:hypothetical protein
MAYMMRHDIWPGVEYPLRGRQNGSIYLGPIVKADDEFLHHNCYDAAGNWEKPYRLGTRKFFVLNSTASIATTSIITCRLKTNKD